MKTIFLLLLAVTMIAAGLLIFIGETAEYYWARAETVNGAPTLEIVP